MTAKEAGKAFYDGTIEPGTRVVDVEELQPILDGLNLIHPDAEPWLSDNEVRGFLKARDRLSALLSEGDAG